MRSDAQRTLCGGSITSSLLSMCPGTSSRSAVVVREAAARGDAPVMPSRGSPFLQNSARKRERAVCVLAGPSERADGRRDDTADAPGAAAVDPEAGALRAAARAPAGSRRADSRDAGDRYKGRRRDASQGPSAASRGTETLSTQRVCGGRVLGARAPPGEHAEPAWRAGRALQKKPYMNLRMVQTYACFPDALRAPLYQK